MKSNEQGVPYNRYQPLGRRSLFVVSWLHLRFGAGSRWLRCMHLDVHPPPLFARLNSLLASRERPDPDLAELNLPRFSIIDPPHLGVGVRRASGVVFLGGGGGGHLIG